MVNLRFQGNPWNESCAASEGFCPDCLTPLQSMAPRSQPSWCRPCERWWFANQTDDGVPQYGYTGGCATEWYNVHDQ